MIYTKYIEEEIFSDNRVNALCNYLITMGSEAITNQKVILALTGTPARILQGETKVSVNCVPFITADEELFNYYRDNMHKIPNFKSFKAYENVLQCIFEDTAADFLVHIEIWMTDSLTLNELEVTCQNLREIPNYII